MMEQKLFDSERRVMQVLWEHGDLPRQRDFQKARGNRGLEQKHNLYRHQKMRGKGLHRPAGARIRLPRPALGRAGATARGRRAGKQSLFRLALAAVCVLLGGGRINQAEIDKLRRLIDDYE